MSNLVTIREQIREVTWVWWLLVLLGIRGLVAGVIVIAKPSNSLTTLAVVCGVFVLIDSIFELPFAIVDEGGGAAALIGVLGVVVGILLIRHPVHSVLAVALLRAVRCLAARRFPGTRSRGTCAKCSRSSGSSPVESSPKRCAAPSPSRYPPDDTREALLCEPGVATRWRLRRR